jgi:hypothetical protein
VAHCCLRSYNCCIVKFRWMVIMSLPLFNSLWSWTCIFLFYKETTGRVLANSNCPRVWLLISRFCCSLPFSTPLNNRQVSVILCGSFSYVLILMTVMGYEHLWCGCSHAGEYNTTYLVEVGLRAQNAIFCLVAFLAQACDHKHFHNKFFFLLPSLHITALELLWQSLIILIIERIQ